jgi:hypothetical protein
MRLLWFAAPLLFAALSPAQVSRLQFPASLKNYLQLTDAQVSTIVGLDTAYDSFNSDKQARIAQVRQSIADLTGADQLDPLALGNAYAEIEAINRDLRDKLNQLQSDLANTLTAAQSTRLKLLAVSQGLLPLASTAVCENYLTPPPASPTILDPAGQTSGSFSSFIPGIPGLVFTPGQVCATLTVISTGGTPVFSVPENLRAYLGLSPAQVASDSSLRGSYQQFVADKQQRIAQVQQEIANLTGADTLDPMALGLAYAELEAINRDVRDKSSDLRAGLNQLLTAPQAAKLKALDDADALQPVINAAVCESLLAPAPTLSGTYAAAFTVRAGDFSSSPIPLPGRFCGL